MTKDEATTLIDALETFDFMPVEEVSLRAYVCEYQVYVPASEYFNTSDLHDLIEVATDHGYDLKVVAAPGPETRAYFTLEY